MRRLFYITFVSLLIWVSCTHADNRLAYRPEVQHFIRYMVKQHHFKRSELIALFRQVQYQPKIIESMDRPYEKKNWDVYKQLFLTSRRVESGVAFWQANQAALAKAEQYYGVPANIIVAILGVETLYGENQGNYRVIDALSTLAFYYPKRKDFFTKELVEFLLLCKEHRIAPTAYLGSYAGAMGKPQFMPSSYRYYAASFSDNPKKDLMHDDEAVIASVANYFFKHGWSKQKEIAYPVQVEGKGYKQIHTEYKTAAYNWEQLKQAGITYASSIIKPATKVGLIELTTANGPEFWLTYPNFYVITRYNTSPQYALTVHLLALQVQHAFDAAKSSTPDSNA